MSEDTKANLEARLAKVRSAIDSHLEDGALTEYSTQDDAAHFERLEALRAEERDLMYRIRRLSRGSRRRVMFKH